VVGRLRRTVAAAALCCGLAVLVIGTFLPWVRSGRTDRNSYAGGSALRRLVDVAGPLDAVLRVWPFVSLAAAGAIALLVLGRRRSAAALAALAALPGGAGAAWALSTVRHGLIRPAGLGPTVTLIGAGVTVIGVLACLQPHDRPSRRPA
jgi:hypothetical protein